MARLIRMDRTGHSTLAEWAADDRAAYDAADGQFRAALEEGYIGVQESGSGRAVQLRSLPLDADLVILRRPIAGG